MASATQAPANAGGPTQHTLIDPDGLDFEDAVRAAEKARLALTGPSGSGKTYTALSIGTGLLPAGGTLGVIDTERGSASKYAGLFTFKTMKLPSYEPQALIRALAIASARGIDVVVIDSLTHFWSGRGGALAQVDAKTQASSSKNAFTTGWKDVSPLLLDMLDAILAYPGHVITTMRVKTEWVIQENERGKREPTKMGTKLDQRDGIDYEFDLVGALDQNHVMRIDKSRYPTIEVDSRHEKPDFAFGHAIAQWLDDGEGDAPSVMDYLSAALDPQQTPQQLLTLLTDVENRGLLGAAVLGLDRQATSLGELIKLAGAAARVKDPATSTDDLRAMHNRFNQSRRLGAMVPGLDGQPVAIGDLITFVGTAKAPAIPAATPTPEPQPGATVEDDADVETASESQGDPAEQAVDTVQAGVLNKLMQQVRDNRTNPDVLRQVRGEAEAKGLIDCQVQGPGGAWMSMHVLLDGLINQLARSAA